MKQIITLFVFACAFVASLGSVANDEVTPVASVTLDNYLGRWFELYRVPNSFQDNTSSTKSVCWNTVAEYGLLEGGKISVTNTCTRTIDGKAEPDVARALASVVPNSGNAKLLVNFTGVGVLRWLGIGDGDYWILGLGPVNSDKKYQWALVGSPSRKYGWILSRSAELPKAELDKIFAIAQANGYQREQFALGQGGPR